MARWCSLSFVHIFQQLRSAYATDPQPNNCFWLLLICLWNTAVRSQLRCAALRGCFSQGSGPRVAYAGGAAELCSVDGTNAGTRGTACCYGEAPLLLAERKAHIDHPETSCRRRRGGRALFPLRRPSTAAIPSPLRRSLLQALLRHPHGR